MFGLIPLMQLRWSETLSGRCAGRIPATLLITGKTPGDISGNCRSLTGNTSGRLRAAIRGRLLPSARRYGLHQITIAGISDNEEPSPQRLALLHQYIRRTHTPVLFAEADASQQIARTLAHDTQVRVRPLNPLESLTTTEMRHGANYLTVMRANLQELKHAIH